MLEVTTISLHAPATTCEEGTGDRALRGIISMVIVIVTGST